MSLFFELCELNIDISRNCMYSSNVQRVLEEIRLIQMNKLHLHATDSQSWPLEVQSILALAEKGAYHKSPDMGRHGCPTCSTICGGSWTEAYIQTHLSEYTASILHSFLEHV